MEREKEYEDVLLSTFGYRGLREEQMRAVYAVLEEKMDVFIGMATGGGKSMCYQLPPLIARKRGKKTACALIISPLIALMRDQVRALSERGIPAISLSSGEKRLNAGEHRDVFNGAYAIVYVTPERVASWVSEVTLDGSMSSLQKLGQHLVLVAIDESHCICSWHDFRPSYGGLGALRGRLSGQRVPIPIMALTASATPQVQSTVIRQLCLSSPRIIKTSIYRPNLHLRVRNAGTGKKADIVSLLRPLTREDGVPTLIYCQTRAGTEKVAHTLSEALKREVGVYHAGLEADELRETAAAFADGRINVVAATIAFGLGINKSNIRQVIHWGPPKSVEQYYQEIGRAGRDGAPSSCHLFWNEGAFSMAASLVETAEQEAALLAIKGMLSASTQCLWASILRYFGEEVHPVAVANSCERLCSRCTSEESKGREVDRSVGAGAGAGDEVGTAVDVSADARLLLRALLCCGKVGQSLVIDILRGSKSSKVTARYSPTALKNMGTVYGGGKPKTAAYWSSLLASLVAEGYVVQKAEHTKGGTMYFTHVVEPRKGTAFLNSRSSVFRMAVAKGKEENDNKVDGRERERQKPSLSTVAKISEGNSDDDGDGDGARADVEIVDFDQI